MRTDRLKINKAAGLKAIKNDLRKFLKDERTLAADTLEEIATDMYYEAQELVPLEYGALQESIDVHVSYSPRYPGLIATATARNVYTGYDYALIQHENDDYEHDEGRQAHYLEDPFDDAVERFYEEMGYDK